MECKNTLCKAFVLLVVFTGFLSCVKTVDSPEPTPKDNDDPIPQISKLKALARHWKIDTALHDGNYDVSSSGKDILFRQDGSYTFDASLDGSWRFSQDSTHILIDENTSFFMDWTIDTLSDKRFEVRFNSPFTGKLSIWKMNEY